MSEQETATATTTTTTQATTQTQSTTQTTDQANSKVVAAESAEIEVKTLVGADNIIERANDVLRELLQQVEARNTALQRVISDAQQMSSNVISIIPDLLTTLDGQVMLTGKFEMLLTAEHNQRVAKFREVLPYFVEVTATTTDVPANVTANATATSANATHLMPAVSNLSSLVAPATSPEPKDPVNPSVFWPNLVTYLRDVNNTAVSHVMNAMDWHTRVFKTHDNLINHYKRLLDEFQLVMNEMKAQLNIIESTCLSVKEIMLKFKEMDDDVNVPPNIKDDFRAAYNQIRAIHHTNKPLFREFYDAKQMLLDMVRPLGRSYVIYRQVVVASRNLLGAQLNQIVEGWRTVGEVVGQLLGAVAPEEQRLSRHRFKFTSK